jgi:single-stranded-DNA-specific exonuclease
MSRVRATAGRRVIPVIVRQILEGRNVPQEDMERFVYPDYDQDLHDPWLLADMQKAIDRIETAAAKAEKVVVYGDYDIDGITASAVMIEALEGIGITAESYIPDRFEEGYGINAAALKKLKDDGVDLVISVDCGITSVLEANWAKENGLDLIVTDHHTVPEILPDAVAVINPKRPGDRYPFKELAGVGVAFKVACAIQQRTGKPDKGQEKWLLDLVAFGTVCDLVPLVGENRVLVKYGLKVMQKTRRIGLRSLAESSKVDLSGIQADHLGFRFGPRMNAAGRLENAACALELVRTKDRVRADEIADELEHLNRQRKSDQEKIFLEADKMAEADRDSPILVLASESWSHGIVGIVASKLVEKWQKPVLVAQILGDSAKGSGRSVPGFNLVQALRENEGLLSKYGGHYFAAGFTVSVSNLDKLRDGLGKAWNAREEAVDNAAREAEIARESLDGLSLDLIEELGLLEPFGHGNPRPSIELRDLTVVQAAVIGVDGKHLKLTLKDSEGRKLGAIGFGMAVQHSALGAGLRLTARGELNKNEYLGRSTLQLMINELIYE